MTINTNTKNPALRTTTPNKTMKPVYCTDNGKRWPSATECAEDLGVTKHTVYQALNGILKTCKGLHLCYEEDVAGVQTGMSNTLVSMSAEVEALRAEVERLRKVECVRIENQDKIARLEKSIACHKRAYDSHMKAASAAMKYLAARQKELDELLHKSEEK